jgi:hypothetical protein
MCEHETNPLFFQKNAAKVGVGVMLESFNAPEEGLLPEP